MAKFVMLTTLTDEGRRTLKDHPERLREVNREIEAMGAVVVDQYAVLGPYDFVNILEAPGNEAVSRVAMALGARGTLIGRSFLYGLGAMGEAGVTKALEVIHTELDKSMAFCGHRDITQVTRDILRVPRGFSGDWD